MPAVERIPIQSRELDAAIEVAAEGVLRRAAQALAAVMRGGTVVIEERVATFGDEEIIEETILEAGNPGEEPTDGRD